jgi:PPOX class probable F420-dependent enzyme
VTLEELPGWAGELLATGRVGRLAFLDDEDLPRVLPVTYAVLRDSVWSAIDDKPKRAAEPARVRYLRRRPEAALCVDRYSDDWSRLAWVQLLGRIDVISAAESSEALEALAARYEPYRERTPPGPLLRLSVERTLSWRAAG